MHFNLIMLMMLFFKTCSFRNVSPNGRYLTNFLSGGKIRKCMWSETRRKLKVEPNWTVIRCWPSNDMTTSHASNANITREQNRFLGLAKNIIYLQVVRYYIADT